MGAGEEGRGRQSFIFLFFILKFFSFYYFIILLFYFLISTWRPVIVHVDATSSVNDKFDSKLNGCMKVSPNYNFMYHSGMKKTSCNKC